MRTIGNILWVFIAGFWTALMWALAGILLCITVIGIPFGIQCFKMASFTFWPFGREAVDDPTASSLGVIGNILWFIPGVILAISYAISGVGLMLTIIGIPFGLQAFKFIPLALFPFGKRVVNSRDYNGRLAPGAVVYVPQQY